MQFLTEFKNALSAAGYATDDVIKADDRLNRAHRVGDNKAKRDIRYQLTGDDSFAFGWFIYQGGERVDWFYRPAGASVQDPAAIAAQQAKVAAQRQAAVDARLQTQRDAAKRAAYIWEHAGPPPLDHAYVKRKAIAPAPARLYKGVLVVPRYNELMNLVSLQFIAADGTKRYQKDGAPGILRLHGSPTLALCEGWATGATIHAATGWTVDVCFDTAGLKAYAASLRSRHPDADVVICADDDSWVFKPGKRPPELGEDKSFWPEGDSLEWILYKKDGLLFNPGIEAAQAALKKVGGSVRLVAAKFQSTKTRPTDFNDLQALEGLQAVTAQLLVAPPAAEDDPTDDFNPHDMTDEQKREYEEHMSYMNLVPPDKKAVAVKDDAWKDGLLLVEKVNKKTKETFVMVEPKSQNNIYLMTRYCEELRGIFILNEFSRRKMVVRCPPWEKANKFRPRDVRDDDYTRVCMELERLGMKPSVDRVSSAIESICHDRSFHPVQKYFNSIKWDGNSRLHNWLTYYLGADKDPALYLTGVGTKWMVAAVARIFQPGCKFDHMLVLEGITDIGKSAALRKLATFHGEEYFYDGLTFAKIDDKDTMLNIQGSLIIEFPELSSLQSREVEDVKQWITVQEDRGRKPYGKEPVMFPRQFVLAGSTNNSEYLKDATGNKRFWPVMCGDHLDLKALERDREQLWAEAVQLYKDGYQWWIPEGDDLVPLSKAAQLKRMVTHPWEDDVLEFVRLQEFVTVRDILVKCIDKPLSQIKRADDMAIADILRNNGFVKCNNGKRRGWERVNTQQTMEGII